MIVAMWLALLTLATVLWLNPEARSLADTFVQQIQDLLNAQLPVFLAAFALTVLASACSWFWSNAPRRQPAPRFRVVRRYWVQQ